MTRPLLPSGASIGIFATAAIGVRRRQLQTLFRTPGYDPLHASGIA